MVFIDADVSCILYVSLLAKPKLRIAGQVCVVAVAVCVGKQISRLMLGRFRKLANFRIRAAVGGQR